MGFHYVYQLLDVTTLRKYIGVRTSDVLPEFDPYMSSSRTVKRLIKSGRQFEKTILSVWDTRRLANLEEARLHELYNVGLNPEFINLARSPFGAVHGTALKGRTYDEIFGPGRAAEIRARKRLIKRTFTEETRHLMSENHADVSGVQNPRAISGQLFSKSGELLTSFSTKRELVAWCRTHGIPHRRLLKEGSYNPPVGMRNRKFAEYFGLYVVITS